VKLGMDGIKKAAEGAKKPFDDLKTAVSGTFEKGLKGPVQDIAGLLPKLTAGFRGGGLDQWHGRADRAGWGVR
jgi:hypothetical protein